MAAAAQGSPRKDVKHWHHFSQGPALLCQHNACRCPPQSAAVLSGLRTHEHLETVAAQSGLRTHEHLETAVPVLRWRCLEERCCQHTTKSLDALSCPQMRQSRCFARAGTVLMEASMQCRPHIVIIPVQQQHLSDPQVIGADREMLHLCAGRRCAWRWSAQPRPPSRGTPPPDSPGRCCWPR